MPHCPAPCLSLAQEWFPYMHLPSVAHMDRPSCTDKDTPQTTGPSAPASGRQLRTRKGGCSPRPATHVANALDLCEPRAGLAPLSLKVHRGSLLSPGRRSDKLRGATGPCAPPGVQRSLWSACEHRRNRKEGEAGGCHRVLEADIMHAYSKPRAMAPRPLKDSSRRAHAK